MKVFWVREAKKRSQRGFTLVELMIALAVSAMLMVGSMQLLSHMVVTTAQNRAKTMAMLQVQYVGFWITEDVVQARPDGVTPTDPLNPATLDSLLTIQWTQWNGVQHRIVYSVEPEGDGTWTLYRNYLDVAKDGVTILGNGTTVVGELLDPTGTPCNPGGTRCEWVTGGNATDVLRLDVSAVGDPYAKDPDTGCYKYEVSRTYEINPRSK